MPTAKTGPNPRLPKAAVLHAGRAHWPAPLLATLGLGLAVGCGDATAPPASSGAPEVSGAQETGLVGFRLSLAPPPGAAGVRVAVTGKGQAVTQQVPFETHGLPAHVDAGQQGRAFADALFVLAPGAYQVAADVVDGAGKPLEACKVTGGRATVMPGVTTEVTLAGACKGMPAGSLDVAVTTNTQPSITSLDISGGKFVCAGELVQIAVGVSDPDGDGVKLSFSVSREAAANEATKPGADAKDAFCLQQDNRIAGFATDQAGTYHVTVQASDGKSEPAVIKFPLHVTACSALPTCAGERVSRVVPKPTQTLGQCSCKRPGFVARLHQPQGSGMGVMPPYLKNPRSVLLERALQKGEAACPDVDAWKGTKLAVSSGANQKTTTVQCGYRWTRDDSPDYARLGDVGYQKLACDQPTMAPTGAEALPAAVWTELQGVHWNRVRRYDSLPQLSASPVRVAVLDSAAHGYAEDARERFGHGRSIGRTIADLLCADPSSAACAAQIHNYLTLDRVSLDGPPDRLQGGYYGDFQTLAIELHRALDEWVATGGQAPLVMNLSLGWDARHLPHLNAFRDLRTDPGDCPRDEPALLHEAIFKALERASCLGALVVAAAGNEDNLGADLGPFLPAGWETLPAIEDPVTCAAYLPTGWFRGAAAPASSAPYRPLVFGAMGTGLQDTILGNTRTGGKARLAGAGQAVVTNEWRSGGPAHTQLLSGSSMGTAVVSGVAAAAWAQNVKADRFQVMQWLYETGRSAWQFEGPDGLDLLELSTPDFHAPGCSGVTCLRSRTVQHCQAIAAARASLGAPPLTCPTPAPEPPPPGASSPGVRVGMDVTGVEPTPAALPIWGLHMTPWIRPAPEPFGCAPGYCVMDIYPYYAGSYGFLNGAFDAPADARIYATQVHHLRPFAPTDTRLIFYSAPGYTPVPADGTRFSSFMVGLESLYAATLTNWVYSINGSGLISHSEVVVVINH